MLKKIFGKKSHTLDSLTSDYHSLEQRKGELTGEITSLKKSAFKGEIDTKKLVDSLQKLELELGLLDPAMDEVKRLMTGIISKEIETDYKGLPAREKKYQSDFDKQAKEAGAMLGQVVRMFESLGKQPFGSLAGVIRQHHQDALLVEKTAQNMQAFDSGFLDAMNSTVSMPDFKAEAKAIDSIKGRAPGSEPARNRTTNIVNRMLRDAQCQA